MRRFLLGLAGGAGASRGSSQPNCLSRHSWFSGKNATTQLLWALTLSSIAMFCIGCHVSPEIGISTLPAASTSGSGITVDVVANPNSLLTGSAIQYAADVSGDSTGDGVVWVLSQNGVACTGTACGSLSNSTISSVTYNPPASSSSAIQVQLTAYSVANPAVSGSATITTLQAGSGSEPFTATVAGDSSGLGVTWSLSEYGVLCTGTGSGCGSLSNIMSSSVTYTPPASVSSATEIELIATSVADKALSDTSTIIVSPVPGTTGPPPTITVSVSPNPESLQAGGAGVPFTATVTGSTAGVTWGLSEDGEECSGCGSLTNETSTTVTYVPPPTVSSSIEVQLTATVVDTTVTASVSFFVTPIPPITITVAPNPDSLQAGTSGALFTATVMNSTAGVTWSLICPSEAPCGSLSNPTSTTVTYVPPPTVLDPITVQLVATLAESTITGSATITVTPASTPPLPTVPRFLYSTNNSNYGRITIHSVNASTGQLRFDGYASLNAAGDGISPAVLSSTGYLYTADTTTAGVYGFSIASNGQLTPVSSSVTFIPPSPCANLAVVTVASSQDTYLYCFGGGNVTIMSMNSFGTVTDYSTATLSETAATQMVFDPAGQFAYLGTNTGVAAYSISPGSGTLTALNGGTPYAAGGAGTDNVLVTVSPNGSTLYAVNPNDDHVYAFTIGVSGALTAVGTAQATGSLPSAVAIDPLSQFLFVSNEASSNISPYVINSGGSLTAEALVTSGAEPGPLTVDPSDKFLYVEDQVGSQTNETGIQSFAIGAGASLTASLVVGEPEAGSLTILSGSAAVAYTPQFAYTANEGFSNISGYQVNATTGALTAVTGSPFSAGTGAGETIDIVADPFERFVFAVNASDNPNTVSAFKITTSTGALVAATGSPFATGGFSNYGIAEDASGRFVYTMSASTSEISGFNVNQSSGALTTIPSFTSPELDAPGAIANSPFGSTLFVTNKGDDTVSVLAIGPSGTVNNFSNSPFAGSGPSPAGPTQQLIAAAVDPSNRFVYFLDVAGDDVAAYQFTDANTESPASFAPISGGTSSFPIGPADTAPESIAIEPTGHYLYVTSSAGPTIGYVAVYAINQTNGALVEVGSPLELALPITTTGGGELTGAAVDPSGQFLYAVVNNDASSGFNSVGYVFTIDPANGTLTQQSTTFSPGYGATAVTITGTAQ
jgi:6-phosphogluconolactonase